MVSLVRLLVSRFERFGIAASTCRRKYCGAKVTTATEQGAAPDRLQLHSFRSSCLLTSLIPLPAAGELSVVAQRAASQKLGVLVSCRFSILLSCKYLRRRFCDLSAFVLALRLGFCVLKAVSRAQLVISALLFSRSFWFQRFGSRVTFGLLRCQFGFTRATFALLQVIRFCSRAAFGFSRARQLQRKLPTMPQQGAAPDRLQLRSSCLLSALPAAGELGVVCQVIRLCCASTCTAAFYLRVPSLALVVAAFILWRVLCLAFCFTNAAFQFRRSSFARCILALAQSVHVSIAQQLLGVDTQQGAAHDR